MGHLVDNRSGHKSAEEEAGESPKQGETSPARPLTSPFQALDRGSLLIARSITRSVAVVPEVSPRIVAKSLPGSIVKGNPCGQLNILTAVPLALPLCPVKLVSLS